MAHAFNYQNLVHGVAHCTQCGGTPTADAIGHAMKPGWLCPTMIMKRASTTSPSPPTPTPRDQTATIRPTTSTPSRKRALSPSTESSRQDEQASEPQSAPSTASTLTKRRRTCSQLTLEVKPDLTDAQRIGETADGEYLLTFGEEEKRFKSLEYLLEYVEIRHSEGNYHVDKTKRGLRYYFCAEKKTQQCPSRRTVRCLNSKKHEYQLTETGQHNHVESTEPTRQRWTQCMIEEANRLLNLGVSNDKILEQLLILDPPFSSSLNSHSVANLKYRFFQRSMTGSHVDSVRSTNMEMLMKFVATYQKEPDQMDDFWIFSEATLPLDGSDFQLNFSTAGLVLNFWRQATQLDVGYTFSSIDGSFPPNCNGYCFLNWGTGTADHQFRPGCFSLTANHRAENYEMLASSGKNAAKQAAKKFLGITNFTVQSDYTMTDSEPVNKKFVACLNGKRHLACFYHLMAKIVEHRTVKGGLLKGIPEALFSEIKELVSLLHLSPSDGIFDRASKGVLAHWRTDQRLGKWMEYFERVWLKEHRFWYISAAPPGIGATNNQQERTMREIKKLTNKECVAVLRLLTILVPKIVLWSRTKTSFPEVRPKTADLELSKRLREEMAKPTSTLVKKNHEQFFTRVSLEMIDDDAVARRKTIRDVADKITIPQLRNMTSVVIFDDKQCTCKRYMTFGVCGHVLASSAMLASKKAVTTGPGRASKAKTKGAESAYYHCVACNTDVRKKTKTHKTSLQHLRKVWDMKCAARAAETTKQKNPVSAPPTAGKKKSQRQVQTPMPPSVPNDRETKPLKPPTPKTQGTKRKPQRPTQSSPHTTPEHSQQQQDWTCECKISHPPRVVQCQKCGDSKFSI